MWEWCYAIIATLYVYFVDQCHPYIYPIDFYEIIFILVYIYLACDVQVINSRGGAGMESEPAHHCTIRLEVTRPGHYRHLLWLREQRINHGVMFWSWKTLSTSEESNCHWKERVWGEPFRRKTSLRSTPNMGRCPKQSRSSESSASYMTNTVYLSQRIWSYIRHGYLPRDCYERGLRNGGRWRGLLRQYLTIPHCHQTLSSECHQNTLSIGEHYWKVNLTHHGHTVN